MQFADLVRRELDTDEIRELIRRTAGIEPEGRVIAYHFLADGMKDAEISAQEGVFCSRSTVSRRLPEVIPIIKLRYEKDKQLEAGA